MKKSSFILLLTVLALCIISLFFFPKTPSGQTRVSAKDDESSYTFSASFHPDKTTTVFPYLDSCAKVLQRNQANIRIQTAEGRVEITADKQLNSSATMKRIKKMCVGINALVLKD